MRDPLHSRTCRLSSVQRVRTSQLRGAPLGASVPASIGAYRRIQLAARTGALVWEFRQGRQPLLWANRQYLRLRTRSLEMASGCGWKLLPSCTQTGTILATAPSPRAYPRSLPIRSSPLHSWKSPHQIRLALPQGGRAHSVCHGSGHCQLLMKARSTEHLFFVGQNIGGLSINLAHIPARDALTTSLTAAFSLSLQPQLISGSNYREMEEELSGHTGRAIKRHRTGSRLSWACVQNEDGPGGETSPINSACGEIYSAERTGFSCEGLQNQDVESYPSKKSPPIRGAVRANISAQESASRRRALHSPQDLRTVPPSQNQYIASGTSTWLEAVAPPSLSISAWMVSPRKSPHRVRLALSQGCRENRKRLLRSRRCQFLTAERQAMNLPSVEQQQQSF